MDSSENGRWTSTFKNSAGQLRVNKCMNINPYPAGNQKCLYVCFVYTEFILPCVGSYKLYRHNLKSVPGTNQY